MALLHRATLSPSKAEIITGWLPEQPWASGIDDTVELVGAFRFDDPDGRVGLEVHFVRSGDVLLHVPLTYREAPLHGADDHLLGTMQHSVLGDRWVYDGLGDPVFVTMLAAAAMTGCGQAVGVVEREGRVLLVPTPVHLIGGGWTGGPAPIDGFASVGDDDGWAVLRSDRFELRVARRPVVGERPPIGLTAVVPGHVEPVVLAAIAEI